MTSSHPRTKPANSLRAVHVLAVCLAAILPAAAAPAQELVFDPPGFANDYATADSGDDEAPRIAFGGDSVWIAVWHSFEATIGGDVGDDPDIVFARSDDGGMTWSAAATLNTDAAADGTTPDTLPAVASGGGATWVCVWVHGNDSKTPEVEEGIAFARSTDDGIVWSPPAPIWTNAPETGPFDAPALASDAMGTWVCVWSATTAAAAQTGTDRDIVFSRSLNDGVSWSPPALIHADGATDDREDTEPAVAFGMGAWIVVWKAKGPEGSMTADGDLFSARSMNGGTTWDAPAPVDPMGLDDDRADGTPHLATDGAGTWFVVWSAEDLENPATEHDIHGSRSTDNGIVWSQRQPLDTVSDAATRKAFPRVAAGGLGRWITVWQTNAGIDGSGSDLDIVFVISFDGAATWSLPRLLNANGNSGVQPPDDDTLPDLAADDLGRFTALWQSREDWMQAGGFDTDIFAAPSRLLLDVPSPGVALR